MWEFFVMQAPLFGGDKLYNALLAGVVLVVGLAIGLKGGSKWGWLLVLAALAWAYITFKDLLFM